MLTLALVPKALETSRAGLSGLSVVMPAWAQILCSWELELGYIPETWGKETAG